MERRCDGTRKVLRTGAFKDLGMMGIWESPVTVLLGYTTG